MENCFTPHNHQASNYEIPSLPTLLSSSAEKLQLSRLPVTFLTIYFTHPLKHIPFRCCCPKHIDLQALATLYQASANAPNAPVDVVISSAPAHCYYPCLIRDINSHLDLKSRRFAPAVRLDRSHLEHTQRPSTPPFTQANLVIYSAHSFRRESSVLGALGSFRPTPLHPPLSSACLGSP